MTITSDPACAPIQTPSIGVAAATSLAATLKALSDPLRLRMLSVIAGDPRGEACVCALTELGEVSQPTVSHHLKVMKDAGLLDSIRRGTWVYYSIVPARRAAVTALLDTFAPAVVTEIPVQEGNRAAELSTLDARVTSLAQELAAAFPSLGGDLVAAVVRESFAGLVRTARVTQHLIPRTERFAKQRLNDITKNRTTGLPQVLFVCVQNAGRSQLAAALLNQISGGAVIARSAGSTPAAEVHPHVRDLLDQIGGEDAFPKPLTDDAVRAADVVVTMGCGDVCPVIPGVRYEDWAVGDPALASADGAAAIRDNIESRVHTLLATMTAGRDNHA